MGQELERYETDEEDCIESEDGNHDITKKLKIALRKKNELHEHQIKEKNQLIAQLWKDEQRSTNSLTDNWNENYSILLELLDIQSQPYVKNNEDVKFQIQAVEIKFKEIDNELAALKTERRQMIDKIKCLEDENEELKLTVEEQENTKTLQELEDMRKSSEIERLKRSSHQLKITKRDEIDEREKLRKMYDDKISNLQKDKEALEKQIREVTDEIKDLKNDHDNESMLMQDKEKEISKLMDKISDSNKKRKELQKMNRKLKEELKQSNEERNGLNVQNEEMKEKIRQMDEQMKDLDEMDKANKGKLHVLEKEKKDLTARITTLEEKIKDRHKKIGMLEVDERKTKASLKVMSENCDNQIPNVAELNRKRDEELQHNEQVRQPSEDGRMRELYNINVNDINILDSICIFCLFFIFIYVFIYIPAAHFVSGT